MCPRTNSYQKKELPEKQSGPKNLIDNKCGSHYGSR